MSGLEGRILTLVKELEEEKRLADKRAKQLYLAGVSFIGHVDTPAAYAAQAGKFVKVNAVPDALIFANIAAGDLPAHAPQAHAASHHVAGGDLVNHDSLTGFVATEHKSLPNTISEVLSNHTLAVHNALTIDHGSLGGKGDDDHTQYYNAARHTLAIHNTLGLMPKSGGTFSGVVYARDHGTGLTDEVVNVCYGTGNPPAANTTTIGTLFVKYTA